MNKNDNEPARQPSANDDLVENARRALSLKQKAPHTTHPESRTASTGMASLPNEATTHERSLQSEGVKPVMQHSHNKSG